MGGGGWVVVCRVAIFMSNPSLSWGCDNLSRPSGTEYFTLIEAMALNKLSVAILDFSLCSYEVAKPMPPTLLDWF